MPLPLFPAPIRVTLLYLSLIGLVYHQIEALPSLAQTSAPARSKSAAGSLAKKAAVRPKVNYGVGALPLPVREMREHIEAAISAGQIEELRIAIEWNEMRPAFAADALDDPIAHFKTRSRDGKGLEILAILAKLLKSGYVAQPLGPDIENNLIYVWPYFSEVPLKTLTPGQQVELLQLISPEEFSRMMKAGKYTGWRLTIGADGTWHEFLDGK